MRFWRFGFLVVCAALSGCVIGYGHCRFEAPVKITFTGRVHFRSYPAPDGIDNVPVLALDRTAYIYAPAHSHQCLSADDIQLVGVAEFPENIGEDTHVSVEGSLFEATSAHQHTPFLMSVIIMSPITAAH
jgi:hypothetical protein